MNKPHSRLCALATGVLALAASSATHAQSVEEFYTGKSITLAIGFQAGGGYDLYGRLVARHIGKHIPGQAEYRRRRTCRAPAACGRRSISPLVAPKDGTAIATFGRQMGITPLLNPNAQI